MEHIFLFRVVDMPGKTYSVHLTNAASLSDRDLLFHAHLMEKRFRYGDHKMQLLAIASRSDSQAPNEPTRLRYVDVCNKKEAEREMEKELAASPKNQSNPRPLNSPEQTEYLFVFNFEDTSEKPLTVLFQDRPNLSQKEILVRVHELESYIGHPGHEIKIFAIWIHSDCPSPDKAWKLIYVNGNFQEEANDHEERTKRQDC